MLADLSIYPAVRASLSCHAENAEVVTIGRGFGEDLTGEETVRQSEKVWVSVMKCL